VPLIQRIMALPEATAAGTQHPFHCASSSSRASRCPTARPFLHGAFVERHLTSLYGSDRGGLGVGGHSLHAPAMTSRGASVTAGFPPRVQACTVILWCTRWMRSPLFFV